MKRLIEFPKAGHTRARGTHLIALLMTLCLVTALAGCTRGNGTNGATATPEPTSTPTPAPVIDADARQVSLDLSGTHQKIDGFGAGFTWYANMIFQRGNYDEVLDLLFKDAGLTILRFKNEYGYSTFDSSATINKLYYNGAKKRAAERGEEVTVLYSSWSPAASLKSNNSINGHGTLKRDENGNYIYDKFAEWWKKSVDAYTEFGIPVDYVSIQNECDYAAGYDGCEFAETETADLASYPEAFLATYRLFRSSYGDNAPQMVAPETMTVGASTLRAYLRPILEAEPGSVDVIGHHLYLGGTSTDEPNNCEPDSFLLNFRGVSSLANDYSLRKWQTEFYRGTALQTANVINNSLIYENANAYIFWGGVWVGQVTDGMDSTNMIICGHQFRDGMSQSGYLACGNYYAMRHFSEFIRPGYTRIDIKLSDAEGVRSSAYKNDDGSTVVLVLLNNNVEQTKVQLPLDNYNLSSSQCYQSVFTEGYTADMMYKDLGSLDANNIVTLPGESATTIVLKGTAR